MSEASLKPQAHGAVLWGRDGTAPPFETASHREATISRLSRLLWYDRSIRWQVLATFLVITLVAAIAAAVLVVYNAQRATEHEVVASIEVAERFVQAAVEQIAGEAPGPHLLETLPLRVSPIRHVRIYITDAEGHPVSLLSPESEQTEPRPDAVEVPRWFSALVQVGDRSRTIPVVSGKPHVEQVGTVVVAGEASDEIAEVWEDMSDLAVLTFIVILAMFAILYVVLGSVLNPLSTLATGLGELEQGRFRHRLPPPKLRELAEIVRRFNALAGSLDAAKADNAQLNRRLITAQDDERRQIAMELHDELGPCLFGMKANVLSLRRLTKDLPADVAERVNERVSTLVEINDTIQMLNRQLLKRVRPMALGHVSLTWAITDLVADFERHAPDCTFVLDIGNLAHSYGDCIDLTVYRCVQESLTNAVRHAKAKTITIGIEEQVAVLPYSGAFSASYALQLSAADDGLGIAPGAPPGLGLAGMEERVRALGGTFTISSEPGKGTRLSSTIPLEEMECRTAGPQEAEECRP